MKASVRILMLAVVLGLLCMGNLFAAEDYIYIWPRDVVLEFSKKNAEENREYFKDIAQAAGISSISNAGQVVRYIINTNPPMDKAKYFVLLPGPYNMYENTNMLHAALRKDYPKFHEELKYSSPFTYIIEQREKYNNFKDVYFFMYGDVYEKKIKSDGKVDFEKIKGDAILSGMNQGKNWNKLCQKYNKICFEFKYLGFLTRTNRPEVNKGFLNVYQTIGILLTEEEYNNLGYIIFITQNYNPYSKEFSVEKRFDLPNKIEQLGFKNTLKLAQEAFQWMDTQATNIQRMATQGGSQ